MNYDLAVVLCLADEGKNRPFDEYVAGIVGRMLEKCPKEKAFLEQFSLQSGFCSRTRALAYHVSERLF